MVGPAISNIDNCFIMTTTATKLTNKKHDWSSFHCRTVILLVFRLVAPQILDLLVEQSCLGSMVVETIYWPEFLSLKSV